LDLLFYTFVVKRRLSWRKKRNATKCLAFAFLCTFCLFLRVDVAESRVNDRMTTTGDLGIPPDAPRPRLCRISKWPDFDGYGFHLQAIKSKPGQFIGKIDDNSPAEAAGLR
jgi:hypothetical protein